MFVVHWLAQFFDWQDVNAMLALVQSLVGMHLEKHMGSVHAHGAMQLTSEAHAPLLTSPEA
jgi:hypothetical protein